MCFRGCSCAPCEDQRRLDRTYSKARTSPESYKSQLAISRQARRFNLTVDDVLEMRESQGDLCAICRNPETSMGAWGKIKSLSIDHDHETGEVRGLLCNNCNRAIGLLGDSVEILQSAITYLTAKGMAY